jgi:hypothetical protein
MKLTSKTYFLSVLSASVVRSFYLLVSFPTREESKRFSQQIIKNKNDSYQLKNQTYLHFPSRSIRYHPVWCTIRAFRLFYIARSPFN